MSDSNNPADYWKLWKSLKRSRQNSSSLTLNKLDNYFTNQVKPPDVNYFDREHMCQIDTFMINYDKNDCNKGQPDLSHNICNGSITEEEILNHINKLKLKRQQALMA